MDREVQEATEKLRLLKGKAMKAEDLTEIRIKLSELTGREVEFAAGTKHPRIRLILENTIQEFAIPRKFEAGCSKNNFYSGMRRKINQRIEQIKARQ